MKAVMLSLRPQWCEKIFNGEKTIEVRKSRPNISPPFEVFVYQTKIRFKVRDWQENFQSIIFTPNGGAEDGNGKVIGSFVCSKILDLPCETTQPCWLKEKTLLTDRQYIEYLGHKDGFGWHITELKIYDKPKELGEFVKPCDWNYDCCTCKRAVYDLTKAEAKLFYGCDREITRPPQSWQYVEEL